MVGMRLASYGLTRTGRPDHQDVVAAGAGNFEGALGGLLAAHVLEVNRIVLGFTQQRVAMYFQGQNPVPRIHEAD